eukprot:scaffold34591_cov32-Tisochrysis_lutea.AAC.3
MPRPGSGARLPTTTIAGHTMGRKTPPPMSAASVDLVASCRALPCGSFTRASHPNVLLCGEGANAN